MSEYEQAELLGGLYEEGGRWGWWVSIRTESGEEHQKLSKKTYKAREKAELALDKEIERISMKFAKDGGHIVSKDGKYYA